MSDNIEIKCTVNVSELETLSAIMSMIDDNLVIEDYSDIDEYAGVYGELIDDGIKSKDRSRASCSVFLPGSCSAEDEISFIRERCSESGIIPEIEKIQVNNRDWENEWKKYYHRVHIGNNIEIVPDWEEYAPEKTDIVVRMDSGMAFGTGTHETTKLSAELIEKYFVPGCTLLDVGCGSGILSIIAKKLGAKTVVGCDLDPEAVRVAKENAEKNECDIDFIVSDLEEKVSGKYDMVVANIVADILVRLAGSIKGKMHSGSLLILSGIIADSKDEVCDAFKKSGFEVVEEKELNDWFGIALKICS